MTRSTSIAFLASLMTAIIAQAGVVKAHVYYADCTGMEWGCTGRGDCDATPHTWTFIGWGDTLAAAARHSEMPFGVATFDDISRSNFCRDYGKLTSEGTQRLDCFYSGPFNSLPEGAYFADLWDAGRHRKCFKVTGTEHAYDSGSNYAGTCSTRVICRDGT